jgi:uncharacterized protein (DUF433 family)
MDMTMATAAKTIGYPHIEKTPDVRGGKACIEGTRIAVVDIVRLVEQGLQPSEMLSHYARTLTLAQVHAALAYYYDNPDEIADYFHREESAQEEVEALQEEYRRRQQSR